MDDKTKVFVKAISGVDVDLNSANQHLLKGLADLSQGFLEVKSKAIQELQGIAQSANHHDAIRRAKEAISILEKL